jgi:hypothetical protein
VLAVIDVTNHENARGFGWLSWTMFSQGRSQRLQMMFSPRLLASARLYRTFVYNISVVLISL